MPHVLRSCAALLEGAIDGSMHDPPSRDHVGSETLGVRNYALHTMCEIYGRRGARQFCSILLDPSRWTELKACFC